jgi:hypothetical protein
VRHRCPRLRSMATLYTTRDLPIVGNHNNGTTPLIQAFGESPEGFTIKVVGWFVKNLDDCIAEVCRGDRWKRGEEQKQEKGKRMGESKRQVTDDLLHGHPVLILTTR